MLTRYLFLCGSLFLYFSTLIHAQQAEISTQYLARGESAYLQIFTDSPPSTAPGIPHIPNVTIQMQGIRNITRPNPNGRQQFSLTYSLTSYELGKHVIPPIEFIANGEKVRTDPVEFIVFNPDDLVWSEATVSGRKFRYALSFRTRKNNLYEGETIGTEIKLYLPLAVARNVEDWGAPEFERDGISIWRFEPNIFKGSVNLLGLPYISLSYPSTLSTTRVGDVSIGPAKVRLIVSNMTEEALQRDDAEEVLLTIPQLTLHSVKLPPAPEGFSNAIGKFEISSALTGQQVHEGEPVAVNLTVTGTGNLNALRVPTLLDDKGWKVYEATPLPRGEERRNISGTVSFTQLLRPTEPKSSVPPYRLIYFDPELKSYKTASSLPLPLRIIPSTSPLSPGTAAATVPPSRQTPVERMTDILPPLASGQLASQPRSAFPLWVVHIIGGTIATLFIAKILWRQAARRIQKDPRKTAQQRELNKIYSLADKDDLAFLKAAGSYVEVWYGDTDVADLREIVATRDSFCFQPAPPAQKLNPEFRKKFIKALRTASLLVTGLFYFSTAQPARADDINSSAMSSYQSAKYEDAIKTWLAAGSYENLAADTLYNIGVSSYRLGSPGHAALYFRRALSKDPSHAESQQNLRFIERKYGSISPAVPPYQMLFTRISIASWNLLLWSGLWIFLSSTLALAVTRRASLSRITAYFGCGVASLLVILSLLSWKYYPKDARFSSLQDQAIVIQDKTVLLADAAKTSPEVIDAPPGTVCKIIRQTGNWAYIATAAGTRGWVLTEMIEKLLPQSPPQVPHINKPKAGEASS